MLGIGGQHVLPGKGSREAFNTHLLESRGNLLGLVRRTVGEAVLLVGLAREVVLILGRPPGVGSTVMIELMGGILVIVARPVISPVGVSWIP
jgi:hypothetical protein